MTIRVGQKVQVDIVLNGACGEVRAEHPDFTKIAFISKRWMSGMPLGALPKVGEEWSCKVDYDTKPAEPRRGVLFLIPIRKLSQEDRWTMVNERVKKGERVVVTHRVCIGERVLRKEVFHVTDESKIPQHCPEDYRQETLRMLDYIRYRKLHCSAKTASVDGRECVIASILSDDVNPVTQEFTLQSADEVQADWPESFKKEILSAFDCINLMALAAQAKAQWEKEEQERREAREAQRSRRELEQSVACELACSNWQQQLDSLVGGIDITISKLKVSQHSVSLNALGDRYGNHQVQLNGKIVGLFDSYADLGIEDFPLTVEQRCVVLSNGEKHTFYSEELSVITAWRDGYYRSYPEKGTICSMDNLERFFPGMPRTWAWKKLQSLSVGDTIGKDCPFQWVNDWLTNGKIRFPRVRPEGSEWRHMPVRAVPKECWELFLSGLEGKFAVDILPWYTQVTTRQTRSSEPRMTLRQKELQSVMNAQMWQGTEGCTRVAIGTNLVFYAKPASGSVLYIVDNPGIGAIYVFSDEKKAKAFASGSITRTHAIELGYTRIIHRDGWQEKVAALISGKVVLAEKPVRRTRTAAAGR